MVLAFCCATFSWTSSGVAGDVCDTSGDAATALEIIEDEGIDEPERSELDDDELRTLASLMSSALEAEKEKRFQEALHGFIEAYTIFPHSNLLLSVARVSERINDAEVALAGYRQFLQRRPDYERRDSVRVRIQTLKLKVAYAEDENIEDGPEVETQVSVEDSRGLPRPTALGWGGVAATTLGLSSLVAGGLVTSSIDDDFRELEQLGAHGAHDSHRELSQQIERKQSTGKALVYGGVGLTAMGAALVAYDLLQWRSTISDDSEIQTSQNPRWTVDLHDSDGVSLRWRRIF